MYRDSQPPAGSPPGDRAPDMPGQARARLDEKETERDKHLKRWRTIFHLQGALYTLADPFRFYTCPACLPEAAEQADTEPMELLRYQTYDIFQQWDQGEAPGDWFRYIGEGSMDEDKQTVFFDSTEDRE